MTNSLSLNIKLDSNTTIRTKDIIILLINGGWNIVREEKITLLPLHDDDMFEWTQLDISMDEFMMLIDQKEDLKELIGVELSWSDTKIGGQILLYSGADFSFELNINTQYIQSKLDIPDFNWYAEKIFSVLSKKYHIIGYNYSFTY